MAIYSNLFDYASNTGYFIANSIAFYLILCHLQICDLQNNRKVIVDKCQLDIGFVLFV